LGKLKKIGIGFGIFLVIIFVLGGITPMQTEENPSDISRGEQAVFTSDVLTEQQKLSTSESQKEPDIFTSDASVLIPTRDDLGTTWQRSTGSGVYDDAKNVADSTGFVELGHENYIRGGGFDTEFLDVFIYKFETIENAKSFYDNFISQKREAGGYKEWTPQGISADSCYGREVQGSMADKIVIYCRESNIVTFFLSAGYAWELKDELQELAQSIHSKI